MAWKRTRWRGTPADTALAVTSLIVGAAGLALQLTEHRIGSLLVFLASISSVVLTFRLVGRTDREESVEHVRERSERKRGGTP